MPVLKKSQSFDAELCLIDAELSAITLHTSGSPCRSSGFIAVPAFSDVPEGRGNALGLDHRPDFEHDDSEETIDEPAKRRAFRKWYAPAERPPDQAPLSGLFVEWLRPSAPNSFQPTLFRSVCPASCERVSLTLHILSLLYLSCSPRGARSVGVTGLKLETSGSREVTWVKADGSPTSVLSQGPPSFR
jgi:hypothetical protein